MSTEAELLDVIEELQDDYVVERVAQLEAELAQYKQMVHQLRRILNASEDVLHP